MDRMETIEETIEETRAEDWAEGEEWARWGTLGWMTMWLHKLEEDERSVTAAEEEEAVAKCALLRAGATGQRRKSWRRAR